MLLIFWFLILAVRCVAEVSAQSRRHDRGERLLSINRVVFQLTDQRDRKINVKESDTFPFPASVWHNARGGRGNMANSTPRRVDLTDKVPVRIRSIFNADKGTLLNLSSTGAYIATPMFLLPQAHIKLQIVLREERRWMEAEAVVVWENRGTVERRDNLPPGYGLRFLDLQAETESVIETLLASDVPPAPAAPEAEAASAFHSEPGGHPYRLSAGVVEAQTPEKQPGIFVLSYDRTQEAHVGRADEDLRLTIASFEGEYGYFYYETIENLEERYARECELFHRLGGDRGQLDNADHPATPEGSELACPVCLHEEVT